MFDVVISLKPSYCVKAHQQVDICEGTFLPHYRDFDAADNKDRTFPVVDFDPVRQYVQELREAYNEIALFFYDVYGCTKIYVLWMPDALKPKEAKIANVKYRLIDTIKNNLELNVEAILDDFRLIGNELVESLVIKNESNIFK
jgi:U3 small nucleolar RNA-associated protein 22